MGFLDSLLGLNQGQPLIDAANQNKTAVGQYGDTANNLIDTGASTAGGYLDQNSSLAQMLLGAAGGQGYQESPGYQNAVDQGMQAVTRGAASRGALGGGGTDIALGQYVTGAADADMNNWFNRLTTGVNASTSANSNLANLATTTAGSKVDVAGNVTNGLTGANNQIATGQQENNKGLSDLFGNILGGVGKLAGGTPLGTFLGGYGGF